MAASSETKEPPPAYDAVVTQGHTHLKGAISKSAITRKAVRRDFRLVFTASLEDLEDGTVDATVSLKELMGDKWRGMEIRGVDGDVSRVFLLDAAIVDDGYHFFPYGLGLDVFGLGKWESSLLTIHGEPCVFYFDPPTEPPIVTQAQRKAFRYEWRRMSRSQKDARYEKEKKEKKRREDRFGRHPWEFYNSHLDKEEYISPAKAASDLKQLKFRFSPGGKHHSWIGDPHTTSAEEREAKREIHFTLQITYAFL